MTTNENNEYERGSSPCVTPVWHGSTCKISLPYDAAFQNLLRTDAKVSLKYLLRLPAQWSLVRKSQKMPADEDDIHEVRSCSVSD